MKRIIPILLSLVWATATTAVAQNKRTPQEPELPQISLSEALRQYRFNEAEQLINAEIATLNKNNQSTQVAEETLHQIERARLRMNSTERVTFIDSLVVPRNEVFKHLKLSSESGQVMLLPEFNAIQKNHNNAGIQLPGVSNLDNLPVFLSQMGEKVVMAMEDSTSTLRLFSSELIGKEWTKPVPAEGLSDADNSTQSYPFMLADGVTLYFAAQGEESLGGFDIFMTRYDVDSHSFLMPENIGMPFNSPANDYLYLVDEFNNLGWFVTDRNQQADSVCIYTFIPNETRKVFNTATVTTEQLRNFARINSIRDTWEDAQQVQAAQQQLASFRQDILSHTNESSMFTFVISNDKIYHQVNDFKSADARKKYEWLIEGKKQRNTMSDKLEELRAKYASANETGKQNLRQQILNLEQELRKLNKELHQQEKLIRQSEMQ